jgi:2-haloacid dehalogenase
MQQGDVTVLSTLVFDIGNVLLRYEPDRPYRRLIPDAAERADFMSRILPPQWNIEQDRGRPWPEAEAIAIAEHPDYAELIRAWRRYWIEMIPGVFEANVGVLERALAQNIPTYAITNFASDTLAEAERHYPFLARFHGRVVSAEERLLKPDPAIYHVFLERFGKRAAECLFMDDSRANVESAARLGFSVVHVTPETDLVAEVRRHGFDV